MEKKRILIGDAISEVGIEFLRNDPALEVDVKLSLTEEDLISIAGDYDAIITRSKPEITAPVLKAATRLKVIGRAGVGVDNIDVPAATRHGVVVMNTPTGNTISTAEHAFSLLMSLARHIPQAHEYVATGRFKEGRKACKGVELNNKTIAILGMGRIGTELARRAMAFGMRVLAYDPYLSANKARLLRVELVEHLNDALRGADFISLHMPLTDETRHMINAESIKLLKADARIINCARGGLVDEAALADALEAGTIGGAALDVYEIEPPPADFPLFRSPKVVLTPHLGASTEEAQETVGIEIAHQVRNNLVDGVIVNAVNMPSIDEKTFALIGPYLGFAQTLGKLISQIAPNQADFIRINYSGKAGDLDTTLVTRSVLLGYLECSSGQGVVNHINAPSFAENLGLRITESHLPVAEDFTELIEVVAGNADAEVSVAGTFFGSKGRIVKIKDRYVEAAPEGNLLLVENTDIPGIVGAVGTLLGKHGLNIANMSLSRNQVGGRALTAINLDSAPSSEVLAELEALEGIHEAKSIVLGC